MASPAPSRPTPHEPDRRRCRQPPTMSQSQVAHPLGEPPNSSSPSPSRWVLPMRRHRAIIQLPDLGLIETVETLRVRGIGFPSLTEALDTTPAQGRLVFHMFGA